MSQCPTDFVDGTKEARENICSAKGFDVPVPCLLKEPTVSIGSPSAATRTSISAKTVKPNVIKPPHAVNGYMNNVKDKATNAAPARTKRKQRRKFSSAGDFTKMANGTASEPHVLPTTEQGATEPGPPVTNRVKSKRWRKATLQPLEEEDWEKECEANLEKRFAVRLHGPEDTFAMAFQDLTLEQCDDMPYRASYIPAVHHPRPLLFSCSGIATEPGQFADADA